MKYLQNSLFYSSLKEEGLGQEPNDASEVINNLLSRGLNETEVKKQYEVEATFSKEFSDESWLVYAPNMKISFGTVIVNKCK